MYIVLLIYEIELYTKCHYHAIGVEATDLIMNLFIAKVAVDSCCRNLVHQFCLCVLDRAFDLSSLNDCNSP
jgi:hypothetical protein